ncbi:acetolactate synthase large subunit [Helicobacter cappadocius]|uniref:Acetolactate synthase n=1 Tax=Helicobacter cappadocius TaxID=3063998 RepID=A0AA90PQL2_9HELI|nr:MULTISPECIES: acetolactate synthase large subunit [unclassified Helicobacter]MDO7252480.1 acetolactate synthase large subunit [Helicobacter sp. faydin-H75]MDP2538347.1 acetolactate synthase large subunit [Helicobacter sp. faydin-H76]
MPVKRLNGSEMLIEALRLEGVKVIFGYPGGAVLNVYDEIYKQNHFKHILTRHEQGAIHAADGYARASAEVGVAIITSGPGFTNAVTGIATAYTDSIPLVVISGQVPISQIGTDAFQEIDAVGISRPCTKHNFLVKSINELPRILKEAFYIAKSGRPGPVLVDLPKDISATYGDFDYPCEVSLRTYKPTTKGNSRQIRKVIEGLKNAKKPLFYIGGGAVISSAADVIKKLIEKTQIPFLETLMARGIVPDSHPLFLGMVGMHGSYAANMAMCECDFLICVGARFDDRVTGKVSEFAKHAKIVHIDIDPSSIGKIIDVNFPVVGDVKSVCEDILELLQIEGYDSDGIKEWSEHLDKYKKLHPLGYQDSDEVLKPQWVIEKIGSILGDKALIVTDVGQHQMWAAQYYPFEFSRQFITSGGLGTMGFGLPASMGAKLAAENKVVVNITGDGSILMNIQELMTCVEEKIPVINVILNNNYLGMVRQWQSFFYESRFSHTDLSLQPDFIKLIEAFGGKGYRVKTKDEFEKAFIEAIDSNMVCMLDVVVDRMEHVLPMVPGGAALNKMILE